MASSEEEILKVGSINVDVVDITDETENEVAPPLVNINEDVEAQLQLDDVEGGDTMAVRIQDYITAGIFPTTIKGATLKDLKKTTSFLNDCSVRLVDKDKVDWFICLLDPCFNVNNPMVIKCSKYGSSNACTHLTQKHGLSSQKTMTTNKKLESIQKQLDLS